MTSMFQRLLRPFILTGLFLAVASCSNDSTSPVAVDTHPSIGGANLPFAWAPMVSPATETLWGIAGSAAEVITVGNVGTAVHLTDGWNLGNTGTTTDLCDVFVSSNTRAFAVGPGGTILLYNGAPTLTTASAAQPTWSMMQSRTSFNLADVYGFGDGTGVVVGESGTILHYDGSAWAVFDTVTSVNLFGVWGSSPTDIYAVGVGGTIIHYDGVDWGFMDTGTPENLSAVWGSSASDVWAVGDNGAIMHFDGATWSLSPSGTTETLGDVWGSSGSDIWAVGSGGTIRHYDGTAWSTVDSGTEINLLGVWGRSACEVYAVGAHGAIFRYGAPLEDSAVQTFQCHDHPKGDMAPPTYGLRIDDLLGEGEYTFSFDYADQTETARVLMTYDKTLHQIHIAGRAYGGKVESGAWSPSSRGWIDIDFTYTRSINVYDNCAHDAGDDLYVTGASAVNTGTFTLDGWGGNASFSFIDRANENGCTFSFDNDWDSKGVAEIANDPNIWSASGWLQPSTSGSRDWLFTAKRYFTPTDCAVPVQR